ncbi:MAG TPA: nitroreductase family deazaflavin-dependent oxidoreductase [Micromonospora sp.]|nr:nitroreductase family deazaflavin-dependent oxidoreductase [Micromonospora sp.]
MAEFAYLTTKGRRTGAPHTIEIWYAEFDGTVYLLSGGGERADWVGNLKQEPRVLVRFGGPRERSVDVEGTLPATARMVTDQAEDDLARRLVARKYESWDDGHPYSDWVRHALVVAVELDHHGQPAP